MRKIVRLPEEYTQHPKFYLCENWMHDNKIFNYKYEILYKNVGWSDGNWHSGQNMEPYAIDFDNPDEATMFALWIGLGIE